MKNETEPIPIDDIMEVYGKAPEDTKRAVTNLLLSGENYLSSAFAGTTPSNMTLVNIDWKANQNLSILMISLMISMGQRRFGEVWRNSLMHQLSQME